MRKHQTSWGVFYKNNGSVLFKSVKVIKDKKRLRNCHKLEDTKKTWQLKAMCDPWLDPGIGKKKTLVENWWNTNKFYNSVNSNLVLR